MRPVLCAQYGQVLVKVIEKGPIRIQQIVKLVLPEILHPRLQDQFRVFPARINRVELNTAGLADKIQNALFAVKAIGADQAMLQQQKRRACCW